MKKRLFLFLPFVIMLFSCVSRSAPKKAGAQTENVRIVKATERIEHLFTHALIAHPDVAFADGNTYGKNLDEDCLTASEFRGILSRLYENGYALIDVSKTFTQTENGARRCDFPFYKNKKPLVLSFDDVVYATKNQGKGLCDKLAVKDGKIYGYTEKFVPKHHGEEFVPILEDFIRLHPDFSFQNARGTIFLTGFDGVLGYRTARENEHRAEETERAKKVINTLKKSGWTFGSHSYAHGHMKKYDENKMRSDVKKWETEVQPLVGKTALYCFPYGEWVLGENCSDPRIHALLEGGFSVFFGVGSAPFYSTMPLKGNGQKVLFQDRCPMDGISMRNGLLSRFFDAKTVYDPVRPIPLNEQ